MSSGKPIGVRKERDELRRRLAALASYPLTSACRQALQEVQATSEAVVRDPRTRPARPRPRIKTAA